MPAVYRTPLPPTFLALPSSRGIMSSFPSPSVYAQDPLREIEMDEIRANQQYLQDQVDQLAVNQQLLEDEVTHPDPFAAQLAIGWT
ncbi:hypothetical protein BU23DRAFT_561133 [Bimuria novae-zelandiae CBS 107.79]|uniref:Uncharacterized protein n=1 Tax=Bimuria novae-zelandiae CBS 107.79 TaxID=1447943 RepID=A0A6A5UNK9_9PLEO|nr:hypothetical protein BU23DRAFT_561133 [Bimuria novae-zelandiae CBS 107.79]